MFKQYLFETASSSPLTPATQCVSEPRGLATWRIAFRSQRHQDIGVSCGVAGVGAARASRCACSRNASRSTRELSTVVIEHEGKSIRRR